MQWLQHNHSSANYFPGLGVSYSRGRCIPEVPKSRMVLRHHGRRLKTQRRRLVRYVRSSPPWQSWTPSGTSGAAGTWSPADLKDDTGSGRSCRSRRRRRSRDRRTSLPARPRPPSASCFHFRFRSDWGRWLVSWGRGRSRRWRVSRR